MPTLQEWKNLAGWGLACTPEERDLVAAACFDAEQRGEKPAVWHEAARIFKTKCGCAKCAPRATVHGGRY